jgi:hypothetical protein
VCLTFMAYQDHKKQNPRQFSTAGDYCPTFTDVMEC